MDRHLNQGSIDLVVSNVSIGSTITAIVPCHIVRDTPAPDSDDSHADVVRIGRAEYPGEDMSAEFDAIADDLIAQGHAPGRWVITSAAPGERLVPCFAACTAGAEVVGYAATRSQAKQVLGCEVAYRAEGYGPDGNEAWEPA